MKNSDIKKKDEEIAQKNKEIERYKEELSLHVEDIRAQNKEMIVHLLHELSREKEIQKAHHMMEH